LPAAGTLTAGQTNYARLTNATAGRYRITFNTSPAPTRSARATSKLGHQPAQELRIRTDDAARRRDAVNWSGFQAWPKSAADGFAPHAGSWCGAIYGKLFSDWNDYGSFSQDVLVTSGKTYRASAWLKATEN
jgi:hypothetical protein